MPIKSYHVVVVCLALLLAGCASSSGYPTRPEDVSAKLESPQEKYFITGKTSGMDVLADFSLLICNTVFLKKQFIQKASSRT